MHADPADTQTSFSAIKGTSVKLELRTLFREKTRRKTRLCDVTFAVPPHLVTPRATEVIFPPCLQTSSSSQNCCSPQRKRHRSGSCVRHPIDWTKSCQNAICLISIDARISLSLSLSLSLALSVTSFSSCVKTCFIFSPLERIRPLEREAEITESRFGLLWRVVIGLRLRRSDVVVLWTGEAARAVTFFSFLFFFCGLFLD